MATSGETKDLDIPEVPMKDEQEENLGDSEQENDANISDEGEDFDSVKSNSSEDGEIDVCGDGTVVKTITRAGEGWQKPSDGAEVFVHYVGKLLDGTVFDSSRERGEPFSFTLGKGVIQGWSDGVKSMKKGEIATFKIQPVKAYGAAGSPPKIPSNATLEFEIELLKWFSKDDLTKDGGVIKKTTVEGKGYQKPDTLTKCKIHLTISTVSNGEEKVTRSTEADGKALDITIDEAQVPDGLELALKSMKKGEEALVTIQPQYGYKDEGSDEWGIPPNATLKVKVTLVDFDKAKESYSLDDPKEKLAESDCKRELGNEWFKKKDYARALRRYKMALSYVEYDYSFTESEDKASCKQKKVSCLLNMAACNLHLDGQLHEAISNCKKALEDDPGNVKALYRLGVAQRHDGQWDQAKQNLKRARELDPENKAIIMELKRIQHLEKAQYEKDKKKFGGWLNKLTGSDSKRRKSEKPVATEDNPASGTKEETTISDPVEKDIQSVEDAHMTEANVRAAQELPAQ